MNPIQMQLAKEARYDARVAAVGLVLFFGCMIALPRSFFWFYFLPMAAFWFRYLIVRDRRDEALLRADIAAGGGGSPAGCYRSEAGICISDGTHHILIARQNAKTSLQLPRIIGRQ